MCTVVRLADRPLADLLLRHFITGPLLSAAADAASAKADAAAARAAAEAAQNSAAETNEKLDRMFKKSMYK